MKDWCTVSLDLDFTIPGKCPHCGAPVSELNKRVGDFNITHNLGGMADAAGIYKVLWRPEEIGVTKAGQMTEALRLGLEKLRDDPVRYRECNASNGWGTYDQFVPWIEEVLAVCIAHPEAIVEASR